MANGSYKDLLKNGGFQSFLWAQFLGAFNDNCYRFVIGLMALGLGTAAGGHYIALALAVFNLPFLLFSGYAGYVADAFSKRSVLIATKSFEILAMIAALAAVESGRVEWMLGILFLLATQAAFFSPAKYGVLPEMLRDKDLSRANGLLEMTTFLASILGPAGAALMLQPWKEAPWKLGLVMVALALAGTAASLGITRVAAPPSRPKFRLNPWHEVSIGVRRLWAERPLYLTTVGISYLWFLGGLCQAALPLMADESLRTNDVQKAALLAALAIGIGVGSLAAGRLSGDKVELGLVPVGSLGMGVFALAAAAAVPSYAWTVVWITALGFSGGLFIVPLYSYLQQRGGSMEKGRLIGANNFLNTIGLFAAAGVLWLFHDVWKLPATLLLKATGIFTLLATIYIARLLPLYLTRFVMWMLLNTVYRIKVTGQENVPLRGPALLVSNHVSYVDAFLIGSCLQRFTRFLVWQPLYEKFHLFLRMVNGIPVPQGTRKDILVTIRRARQELIDGHVVCIFAEGSMTRTGNLLGFLRGFEKIVEGLDVPVIPVYLGGVWGSIFSFRGGKALRKWPRQIPYPVSITFGAPLEGAATPYRVRQEVMQMGTRAAGQAIPPRDLLQARFIRQARKNWSRLAMADTTGRELTYGKALVAAALLAKRFRRDDPAEKMIGVMLPASAGGALANVAALMAGKVPVNLNFTAGEEAVATALEQCGIRTILTSRRFLSNARLEAGPGTIYIEDLLAGWTWFEKARAAVASRLLPVRWLERLHNPARDDSSSLATVVFSSGSTGRPKGVMLSHRNILANADAVEKVFRLEPGDTIAGVLPFFHSFGFTMTIWFPLATGLTVVYHPDPLDAKAVGELVSKRRATMLLAAPSFCRLYARTCTREQFSSLRFAIVGAEKLLDTVGKAFEERFGLPLLEGYGCTEMSPVVAVNIPDAVDGSIRQPGHKPGTVGHPIPGVSVKVVNPETGEELPYKHEGLLLVKGPNLMLGYLGQPGKTREVIRDGWYVTGDIGAVDEDGFVRITDRLARFSKVGGEMVPHHRIEAAVREIIGDSSCAVVAALDEQRGERLVVFHTCRNLGAEELWERLSQQELPRLWLPKKENIHFVEALPSLGTGKLDLGRLKALAAELTPVR